MTADGDGIRLAKHVAALARCSRREAELLIDNGAVRVDGVAVLLPQARVHPHQQVEVDPRVPARPVAPVTLLLHKPAGMPIGDAHHLLVAAGQQAPEHAGRPFLPRHAAGQRCVAPLDAGASGLVVFTQEPRVARKLLEDAALIESEVMVDVAGAVTPEVLAQLGRAPLRASIGQRTDSHTGLRFALKGLQPGQLERLCGEAGLRVLSVKRIRLGRAPLAGLPPGRWRYLLPHERV